MTKFEKTVRFLLNIARISFLKISKGRAISVAIPQFISPFAKFSIDRHAKFRIESRCQIEEGTLLRAGGRGNLTIHKGVFINRNCTIVSRCAISVGERTTIGPNVCIYDHDHDFKCGKGFVEKPISIGKNVWIGAGVIVLKGCNIGNNVVIGAGCVVTKDVPDNTIVYGSNEIRTKVRE